MRLRAVDPDGDLSAGGTELLEESAVRPDPQVLLCDFHLRRENKRLSHCKCAQSKHNEITVRCRSNPTYSTQVPRARSGVQTEEKPRYSNHVVLNKRL